MEIITWLIIGITFLAIGFFLGNYYPLLRDEQTAATDQQPVSEQIREVSTAMEEGTPIKLKQEPAIPPKHNLIEPVRFWRTASARKLMIEFEDSLVPIGGKLEDEEHSKLAMILVDLQDWVGLKSRIEQHENSVEPVVEKQEEPKPVRISYNPITMIRNAVTADAKPTTEGALISIVEQINDELQKLLPDSEYAKSGLTLVEGPNKELQVKVGLNSYGGIDDVPEEGIRMIIRQAIEIWED